MGFIAVLILVTLSIAGSAAFFSIHGLAQIFSGAFWPVVIMASSLEAGKLVAASYAYRYWSTISFFMKSYLITAVFVLMVITSAGIFGFLSSAHQQDVLGIKQNQQQIVILQDEIVQLEGLKQERLDRKKQIDADIASLPNNFIQGRQRLMTSYGPELEQLKVDISEYTATIREHTGKISTLKATTLEQEAHVGPIIFIARAFDRDTDDVTKWLILIIIFAFDPLAVVLTIGANNALLQHKNKHPKPVVEPVVDVVEEIEPPIVQTHIVQDIVESHPPQVETKDIVPPVSSTKSYQEQTLSSTERARREMNKPK